MCACVCVGDNGKTQLQPKNQPKGKEAAEAVSWKQKRKDCDSIKNAKMPNAKRAENEILLQQTEWARQRESKSKRECAREGQLQHGPGVRSRPDENDK